MQETQSQVSSSDWSSHVRQRDSEDKGETWSDWELVYEEVPIQADFTQSGGPGPRGTGPYDSASGCLIKPVFQRIVKGDPKVAMSELWKGNRLFCDHGFYQLSNDDGRAWSQGRQLNYEEGPDFDPDDWGSPEFFRSNEMYIGGIARSSGGVVISSTMFQILASFGLESSAFCCYTCAALLCLLSIARFP
ncbi:MAG TPA: hypothetical protein DIU35_09985 [Candidatus Latescibacteria bacterium]|nr:hypothetical protein [Candidatus Latescibacterota bacterium]|tara:strand:+ start:586 stop:1155 length:570 start_codon:yes stop_codon:yes gene_type:complete